MAEFDKLPAESFRAYAAFKGYRDLGDTRSISIAYALSQGAEAKRKTPNGTWKGWSVKHRWVERAEAWDAFLEDEQRKVSQKRLRKVELERTEVEIESIRRLKRRIGRSETQLDKADAAPITDVTQVVEENGARKATKVKGVNLSGYAKLMRSITADEKDAILGPRYVAPAPSDGRDDVAAVENIHWREVDD